MFDFQKLAEYLSLGNAKGSALLGLAAVPFLSFFGVPVLGVLFLILFVDYITGIWKAKVTNTLNSSRFADLLNRGVTYLVVFVVVHALVGTAGGAGPLLAQIFSAILQSSEYVLFFGYCMKELLSIFENMKAIQVATGSKENFIVESAIKMFGMDMQKMLVDIKDKKIKELVEQPVQQTVDAPQAPVEEIKQNG